MRLTGPPTMGEVAAGFVEVGDWLVAPDYIAPVGITEAEEIARLRGYELPTPALVSAIWQAADLRVEPHPMAHDGTPATMLSAETYARHAAVVREQIEGRVYRLLAGTHKDVVRVLYPSTGEEKLGIFGWHKTDGRCIQPPFTGHAGAWKDYSQGLRLVRRLR